MDNTSAATATGRMEWRRAWAAMRALIADSQRTDLAFEVIDALSGGSFERSFQRLRNHPDGRRLLEERPSLLQTLSDRSALAALPAGSFGRAYATFITSADLSPDGLVAAEAAAEARNPRQPLDADRQFVANRMRDMHDLWHVLTGYGMDEAGEAALLAFNLGHVPNLGMALIVAASAVIGPKDARLSFQRYLHQAWRRGRATPMLSVVPYERLLARPLDEVRQLLSIPPVSGTHPQGILVGNRVNGSNRWTFAPQVH
jgi:ubiquinone biosynthesis protein COQ4